MAKGIIKVHYKDGEVTRIVVPEALKKEFEEKQAEADRQARIARIEQRNAEIQSYETRYRKSPRGQAILPNTPVVVADAQKDMPVQHGTVPVDSELLQGHSDKHEKSVF
jgi:hypothetical protein